MRKNSDSEVGLNGNDGSGGGRVVGREEGGNRETTTSVDESASAASNSNCDTLTDGIESSGIESAKAAEGSRKVSSQ